MTRISFIAIGNELLKGRIVNTNATNAALLLRAYGFHLSQVVTIPDTEEAIINTVEEQLRMHKVVLVSGGLGPTKDDVTKHTLAKFFDTELILHQPSLDRLTTRFSKRNLKVTPTNRLQAFVPAVCEVVTNAKGSAPGMLFRRNGHMLFSMPGVPYEMLYMLEHEVIPRMREAFSPGYVAHEIVRLYGIPESYAADRMKALEEQLPPELAIAYLPRNDGLWIELSVQVSETDQVSADEALQKAKKQVRSLFEEEFYGEGNLPIEASIGRFLKERDLKIAVAESITGGKIAAKIVSISGSSNYFRGSVTAYDTEIKTQFLGVTQAMLNTHSVVSEAVASQMAEGVRQLLNADIGLATTGIAELADPASKENTRVWMGYADKLGKTAKEYQLLNDRAVNIERAANYALIFCWKNLQAHFE